MGEPRQVEVHCLAHAGEEGCAVAFDAKIKAILLLEERELRDRHQRLAQRA
jgi:hypothetical protein